MCGVTKLDKIKQLKNEGTKKVAEIVKQIQERRLDWDEDVMRRKEYYV